MWVLYTILALVIGYVLIVVFYSFVDAFDIDFHLTPVRKAFWMCPTFVKRIQLLDVDSKLDWIVNGTPEKCRVLKRWYNKLGTIENTVLWLQGEVVLIAHSNPVTNFSLYRATRVGSIPKAFEESCWRWSKCLRCPNEEWIEVYSAKENDQRLFIIGGLGDKFNGTFVGTQIDLTDVKVS